MHKSLIIDAFKKARENVLREGKKDTTVNCAKELASLFLEDLNVGIGERRFRDYFKEAKSLLNTEEDIGITQIEIVKRLCNYIGFENYQDYSKRLEADFTNKELASKTSDSGLYLVNEEVPSLTSKTFFIRYQAIISSFIIGGILIVAFIMYQDQPSWMIWQNDRYTEVPFDAKALQKGYLKMYNEDKILYFRKIKPDCQTPFFDQNRKPNLWYGKNNQGKLEYFTGYGLHPETGKTLKQITPYMIQKYLCPSF